MGGGLTELFSGNAASVTLPQSYDAYKVLFAAAKRNDTTGSGVCVPPDNRARFYDGSYNQSVSFSGSNASAPYGYSITRIYAIA